MGGEMAGEMVGRTVGGMAGGTVGGMVSLATRQTPQIDDNTPARGGITIVPSDYHRDRQLVLRGCLTKKP